jgi:fluoride exporter
MSALAWIGVAACGALGALARFLLDGVVSAAAGRELPMGTLAVNASGALLLGFLTGVALRGDALVLAGTAGLGSYTTFSTWMLETQRLDEDGELHGAAGNVLVSVAVGIAAIALGRTLGGHV